MNAKQFKALKNGALKVGKNQIYFDDTSVDQPVFIVEKFEFQDNGVDMFSVLDAFETFGDAYSAALFPEAYMKATGY